MFGPAVGGQVFPAGGRQQGQGNDGDERPSPTAHGSRRSRACGTPTWTGGRSHRPECDESTQTSSSRGGRGSWAGSLPAGTASSMSKMGGPTPGPTLCRCTARHAEAVVLSVQVCDGALERPGEGPDVPVAAHCRASFESECSSECSAHRTFAGGRAERRPDGRFAPPLPRRDSRMQHMRRAPRAPASSNPGLPSRPNECGTTCPSALSRPIRIRTAGTEASSTFEASPESPLAGDGLRSGGQRDVETSVPPFRTSAPSCRHSRMEVRQSSQAE